MLELDPKKGSDAGRNDPDGVRVTRREGGAASSVRVYQGIGLLLVSVCAGYLLMPQSASSRPGKPVSGDRPPPGAQLAAADPSLPRAKVAGTAEQPEDAVAQAGSPSTRPMTPRRAPSKPSKKEQEEEPPELPIPPDRLKDVTMGEYIQALHDAGIYEGLGAFNPPGTSPPLEGLAVPPDYELPEGYVRHHQTTDDGQDIEPILMYSPDYEFLGPDGNPVEIPADRVVPPEHAPPGLPVRTITIPPPREPGNLGR